MCNNRVHLTCLNQHNTSTGLFDKRLQKNKFCQPSHPVGLKYFTYPKRKEYSSAIQKQNNYILKIEWATTETDFITFEINQIHIKSL